MGPHVRYTPGMPRQPRLDIPGLVYHVIARGIERREIFRDDRDREQFLTRLGELLGQTGARLYGPQARRARGRRRADSGVRQLRRGDLERGRRGRPAPSGAAVAGGTRRAINACID